MRVVIHGVHTKVSDRLKEHVNDKLVQPLSRFFDSEAAVLEVHFVDNNGPSKGGVDKECRVTLSIPGARSVHVEEVDEDFYKATDLVRDRVERVLKREIQRMRDPGRSDELQPMGQGSGLP